MYLISRLFKLNYAGNFVLKMAGDWVEVGDGRQGSSYFVPTGILHAEVRMICDMGRIVVWVALSLGH